MLKSLQTPLHTLHLPPCSFPRHPALVQAPTAKPRRVPHEAGSLLSLCAASRPSLLPSATQGRQPRRTKAAGLTPGVAHTSAAPTAHRSPLADPPLADPSLVQNTKPPCLLAARLQRRRAPESCVGVAALRPLAPHQRLPRRLPHRPPANCCSVRRTHQPSCPNCLPAADGGPQGLWPRGWGGRQGEGGVGLGNLWEAQAWRRALPA